MRLAHRSRRQGLKEERAQQCPQLHRAPRPKADAAQRPPTDELEQNVAPPHSGVPFGLTKEGHSEACYGTHSPEEGALRAASRSRGGRAHNATRVRSLEPLRPRTDGMQSGGGREGGELLNGEQSFSFAK